MAGPHFIIELTQNCNYNCLYCYNVWKKDKNYPEGQLDTSDWKKIIKKIQKETGVSFLTLSGGEPLLRKDIFQILECIKNSRLNTTLITNGWFLNKQNIQNCIKGGVSLFEIPILSYYSQIQDKLMRKKGAWERMTKVAREIKKQKGYLVGVIVVTKKNLDIAKTLELAVYLGIDGVMLNRFNPGGRGIGYIKELLPTRDEFKDALDKADSFSKKYGIEISSSIPVQPCLIDIKKNKNLRFGFCPVGTDNAYYAVDPLGNVRICNHSPVIIGNLLKDSIGKILKNPLIEKYKNFIPEFCAGCSLVLECQGGCRASAEASYGSACKEEPFLKQNLHLARRME